MSIRGQAQRTVDRQAIRELRASRPDLTYQQIADEVGCSVASVSNTLNNINSLGYEYRASNPKRPRFAPPRVTDPTLLRKLTAGRAS
jgi:predicted transcriptional regulator